MVHVVLAANGLNEGGHRGPLQRSDLLKHMFADVCGAPRHSSPDSDDINVLYCDDGYPNENFDHNRPTCVELKVLRQLIEHFCPLATIRFSKFSFLYPPAAAVRMIEECQIFYFKGFGGTMYNIPRIFRHPSPRDNSNDDLALESFANRMIFNDPPMLCFMTCGAAITCGSAFQGHPAIKCMKIFGSARVHYFENENVRPHRLQDLEENSIPLGSGVSLVIRLTAREWGCEAINVASTQKATKEEFRAASVRHCARTLQNIMTETHLCTWNRPSQPPMWWAYTPGGLIFRGHTDLECAEHIMRYTGLQPRWYN